MEQPIIKLENVFKEYRLGVFNSGTLAGDYLAWRAKRRGEENPNVKIGNEWRLQNRTFNALSNISFSVNEGERVGIIGANGAGKSTLLKLICRITAPSQGTIYLNGRVASLLEVGTGFAPELTGRENIYLNGAILGMSKAVTATKMDDIISFSDCAKFIDTPVKRYSSGMKIKLGFAVAANLDNEIMIMDEVLAVGDAAFQLKCIDKMNEVSRDSGRTILYVSHMLHTVRDLCDRCLVLDNGELVYDGDTDEAIRVYLQKSGTGVISYSFDGLPRLNRDINNILGAVLYSLDAVNVKNMILEKNQNVEFDISWECFEEMSNVKIMLLVKYLNGDAIGTVISDVIPEVKKGRYLTRLSTTFAGLTKGSYYFNIMLVQEHISSIDIKDFPNVNIPFDIEEPENLLKWNHNRLGHIVIDDAKIVSSTIVGG